MKVKTISSNYYADFLNKVKFDSSTFDEEQVRILLNELKSFGTSLDTLTPSFFALDYTKMQYVFCGNQKMQWGGFNLEEILEGGLKMTLQKMHPDFYMAFGAKVFPEIIKSFKLGKAEQNEVIVTFNHRMKDRNGKWTDLLQKGKYILSQETGLPLFCIGTWTDITSYKTDNSIVLKTELFDRDSGEIKLIDTKFFQVLQDEELLSNREKEVAKYMSDGLSSKIIADKMHISVNTVHNHRQNILRKTNCKNTADFIFYAFSNKLL